jgi:hypothetical protein
MPRIESWASARPETVASAEVWPSAEYGPEGGDRILALLDEKPPAGYANWAAVLIARTLGDVHQQYNWRFLRAQKIDLYGRKS